MSAGFFPETAHRGDEAEKEGMRRFYFNAEIIWMK